MRARRVCNGFNEQQRPVSSLLKKSKHPGRAGAPAANQLRDTRVATMRPELLGLPRVSPRRRFSRSKEAAKAASWLKNGARGTQGGLATGPSTTSHLHPGQARQGPRGGTTTADSASEWIEDDTKKKGVLTANAISRYSCRWCWPRAGPHEWLASGPSAPRARGSS